MYIDIRTATDAAYAHYPFFRAFKNLYDCERELEAACEFELQGQDMTDEILFGRSYHLQLARHSLDYAMELETQAYNEGILGWLNIDEMRKEMPRWMEIAATNPAFLDYYAVEYFLHCNMRPTMVAVPDPANFVEGLFPTQYAWEADAEYQERCDKLVECGFTSYNEYIEAAMRVLDEDAEAFQYGYEASLDPDGEDALYEEAQAACIEAKDERLWKQAVVSFPLIGDPEMMEE